MDYENLSIERLEKVRDNLYLQEVEAQKERRKVVLILSKMYKEREARSKLEVVRQEYEELQEAVGELSWWERLKVWLGL